jgi:hypothetical protein
VGSKLLQGLFYIDFHIPLHHYGGKSTHVPRKYMIINNLV